jgi:hypothetical protein
MSSSSSASSSSSSSSTPSLLSAASAEDASSSRAPPVEHARLSRKPGGAAAALEFDLFTSATARGRAGGLPLFVLLHGQGALGANGGPEALHAHARRLAGEAGCAAATPALARAFAAEAGGSAARAQLEGVAAVVDLVQHCIAALHAPPGGNRNGGGAPLVDPRRVFLCGHGHGGALALEAAIELAQAGSPAAGVVLLDALPWPRTVVRAGSEFFVDLTLLVSLRAEPSSLWNASGASLGVLRAPRIAAGSGSTVCDLLIKGAGHFDLVRGNCGNSGGGGGGGSSGIDSLLGCLFSLCGLSGPRAGADAADELLLAIALDASAVGATAPVLAQLSRFCAAADSLEASGAARRGGGGLL